MSIHMTMKWPEPEWLTDIDEHERTKARVRFFLSLATIYYTDKGDSASLAESIGLSANAFASMKSRAKVPPKTAVDLERELGRALFPRECFCPDIFSIED